MTGDFKINGQDAYDIFGATAEDGFLDALLAPPPKKEYISNKSRLRNGEETDNTNSKFDKKTNVTLPFMIEGFGSTPEEQRNSYLAHLKLFYQELAKDTFDVCVPSMGSEIYHLIYQKPSAYNGNIGKTCSKVSLIFDEPNQCNRT